MKIIWDDNWSTRPVEPATQPTTNKAGLLVEVVLLAFGAFGVWTTVKPKPQPLVPPSSNFNTLGKAYLLDLGKVYAGAWEDGAKQLDAGASIPDALAATAKRWDTDRTALFGEKVSPAFSRLVPEGADPNSVTTDKKSALANAWREFGAGLAGR